MVADPFDSNKSYRTRYESSWIVSYGEDMYMTLKQTHDGGMADTTPPLVNASPPGGTYSSAQSITLSANEPATIYYTTNGAEE